MSRNPVFESARQHGFMQSAARRFHIFGRTAPERASRRFLQPPYSYHGTRFVDNRGILDTIAQCLHPRRVIVDSSVFAESRLDFCRRLLLQERPVVIPEVFNELVDIRDGRAGALRDFLFPRGELNSALTVDAKPSWAVGAERAAIRYANQLLFRRRMLDRPLEDFAQKHGRSPVGAERTRIQSALISDGVSWRSIRLAAKSHRRDRRADEVLPVCTVMTSILTGRDTFLLTADYDVFDQFDMMTDLVFDDYGSFLIGQDLQRRPAFYAHFHAANLRGMHGARAIGRQREPFYLLPTTTKHATCACWVIHVETGEAYSWVATRDVGRAFAFQQATGRVGDDGTGRTVRIRYPLDETGCKTFDHFFVGDEVPVFSRETEYGRVDFSEYDLLRAIHEPACRRVTKHGQILVPGFPS